VKHFIIENETCTIGFQQHVVIDLQRSAEDQLLRRKLQFRSSGNQGDIKVLRNIIERNASLRVEFGWSFESAWHYNKIMDECLEVVLPKYNVGVNPMVSDLRCSWLGFVPYNIFEKDVFYDLSPASLIIFNNDLVDYQTDVVRFISNHEIFKQHSLLRDDRHRFDFFKSRRKNRDQLADAFDLYVDAVRDVCGLEVLSQDLIDEQIGCHFVYNSELYFELLNFYKLKGLING